MRSLSLDRLPDRGQRRGRGSHETWVRGRVQSTPPRGKEVTWTKPRATWLTPYSQNTQNKAAGLYNSSWFYSKHFTPRAEGKKKKNTTQNHFHWNQSPEWYKCSNTTGKAEIFLPQKCHLCITWNYYCCGNCNLSFLDFKLERKKERTQTWKSTSRVCPHWTKVCFFFWEAFHEI